MKTKGMNAQIVAHLQILATSDVHMHLSGHDDLRNRPAPNTGLARLASAIADIRKQSAGAVLLFDNGDTLQGTPMGAVAAETDVNRSHALLEVMHEIGYDAMGVGNHDFDFGLEYLDAFAKAAKFPVLCGNFRQKEPSDLRPQAMLTVSLMCSDGVERILNVGVVSGLPEQTGVWARDRIGADVTFCDPVRAMTDAGLELRTQGADLVIALAHTGVDQETETKEPENFALPLAESGVFDAIVAGHTHQCLPGADLEGVQGVEAATGRLHGIPAVMPGYAAAQLGSLGLSLCLNEREEWSVESATCGLLSATGQAASPEITRLLGPIQKRTSARLDEIVGHTETHLHSYFSLLCPDPAQGLLSAAYLRGLDHCYLPAEMAQLPRLAVVAPSLSGGRAGPDHYVDVPPGPISRRAIEMLCPFEDKLVGVVLTGQEILEWLERSASIYNCLGVSPDIPRLTQIGLPGFNFDMFFGLSVVIDPRQPARYDANGQVKDRQARRINSVHWNNADIDPEQRFLVAMSSYRANGGGKFPRVTGSGPDIVSSLSLKNAVENLLRHETWKGQVMAEWFLHTEIGHKAHFETAPNAISHLGQIYQYKPKPIDKTRDGFLRVEVNL